MAAFLEDPRLRQRWNQISHNAETVTENAAAGIWTFQHAYVNPCLASVGEAFDSCTAVCLGDRDDRARRQRERARGAHRSRAEYSFDFYDDWYDDYNDDYDGLGAGAGDMDDERAGGGGGGAAGASGVGTISSLFGRGFFGSWRGSRSEHWDRLLAGSGSIRNRPHLDGDAEGDAAGDVEGGMAASHGAAGGGGGEIVDQPRRGRGMTYTTRAAWRKPPGGDDPTVIPSSAPLGFLSRLPWKIGGTLRYKPSAANLREHPNSGGPSRDSLRNAMGGRRMGGGADMMRARDENEPLLGGHGDNYDDHQDGSGSRHGPLPWQNELAAADASRQYGTAMSSVPAADGRPVTAGGGRGRGPGARALTYNDDGTPATRQRSGTTSSGDTSNSIRSRGDLFPSDEEDDEDAVPLDDEFAVALNHVDDRSSGRTRFSSSSSLAATATVEQRKGKTRADTGASAASAASAAGGPVLVPASKGVLSRSVSRTTMDSVAVGSSPRSPPSSITKRLGSSASLPLGGDALDERVDEEADATPAVELTADQLRAEDERAAHEEEEAVAMRREAAARLARERGLAGADTAAAATADTGSGTVSGQVTDKATDRPAPTATIPVHGNTMSGPTATPVVSQKVREGGFVPARLPRFD
ncbi:hypothetical protein HMPREF1624_07833 [Sporothrix schenckii ATCC 58251]|uniref:Uncharacterized protein n=1 Tax=Sporothrix schenckii (strain ATCC 58251 / de Perez 2211183) TaxID=1391915 RepID=U7PJD5_SPOS1|nr:hypothetical protein HMPREF1624_07833 [Sporothrix schenckii ATCC 58251]